MYVFMGVIVGKNCMLRVHAFNLFLPIKWTVMGHPWAYGLCDTV